MLSVRSRSQSSRGMKDSLGKIAEEIVEESILICIDEVTDVADALIPNRLFDHLFRKGIVMVSTSNMALEKLYEVGLQRNLFLPFIAILKVEALKRLAPRKVLGPFDINAATVPTDLRDDFSD